MLSGIEQSRFQFSPSAESRRAKRCLARSGMRDLITGAINEGSCCGGLRESEPQKRRGRSSMSGRTDERQKIFPLLPLLPTLSASNRPKNRRSVRPAGRPLPTQISFGGCGGGEEEHGSRLGVMPRAKPL